MPSIADPLPPLTGMLGLFDPSYVAFTTYDGEGRIHGVGTCAADVVAYQTGGRPGLAVIAAEAHHLTDYVDLSGEAPAVRRRPTIAGLDQLPDGAVVEVRCLITGSTKSYTVDDGSFQYDDLPGTYRVTVRRFPYMDFVTEIRL